jgi:excinuclease UvrABC ATPase subunit
MISIVKASGPGLPETTLNLPYHRVIAFTGQNPQAINGFLYSILAGQAQYKLNACTNNIALQPSDYNARFVHGLYTPVVVGNNVPGTVSDACQWPYPNGVNRFTPNPGLTMAQNLNHLEQSQQNIHPSQWQTNYWLRLITWLVNLGLGNLNPQKPMSELAPEEQTIIALAKYQALQWQGLMFIIDAGTSTNERYFDQPFANLLHAIKQNGNTLFVKTHHPQLVIHADWIVEFNAPQTTPTLTFCGSNKLYLQQPTPFWQRLSAQTTLPQHQTTPNQHVYGQQPITLNNVSTHNLKQIEAVFPYKKFTVITGVSGSGKSSLVFDTLLALNATNPTGGHQPHYNLEMASGLMPVLGVTTVGPKSLLTKTVAQITELQRLLDGLFAIMSHAPIDGMLPQQFIHLTIDQALYLTRSWATLPQKISPNAQLIKEAMLPLASIINKLDILTLLGLGYLNLNRPMDTLSGGEQQRARLATVISVELSGMCVVLDEPTRGLHPSEINNLLLVLRELNRQENTIVAIDHHPHFIKHADHIIDLGPGSHLYGGQVVAAGNVAKIKTSAQSVTAKYLEAIPHAPTQPLTNHGHLTVASCSLNNLKNIDVMFPCRGFSVIHGVSGSGKSTLLEQVMYQSSVTNTAVGCANIGGFEHFSQVLFLPQQFWIDNPDQTIGQFLQKKALLPEQIAQLGLDHLEPSRKLGTLSQGELQRLFLQHMLSQSLKANTLLLLDEPTAGLHPHNVEAILALFATLVQKGHCIIATSHNQALIGCAQYIVELGPGGGPKGGQVVYQGLNSTKYREFLSTRVFEN